MKSTPVHILTQAEIDILNERRRQVTEEGWNHEHDDELGDASMSVAAACYALTGLRFSSEMVNIKELWRWTGWGSNWFKPKSRRQDLVRAAALLVAEIERMDRTKP